MKRMSGPLTAWLAGGVLLAGLGAGAAWAEEVRLGSLVIGHPWSRAALAGQNGAAFLTVTNTGTAGDRLVGAASPAAATVELHTHVHDNGVAQMRPVAAIEVTPGAPVTLAPGGLHLMLIGLTQDLAAGSKIPLTLTFEQAGAVTVEAEVEAAGQPGHDHHGGPAHPKP